MRSHRAVQSSFTLFIQLDVDVWLICEPKTADPLPNSAAGTVAQRESLKIKPIPLCEFLCVTVAFDSEHNAHFKSFLIRLSMQILYKAEAHQGSVSAHER